MSKTQLETANAEIHVEEAPPLRTRFAEYIAKHPAIDNKPFSNADAGKEIGYSVTMVSRYLRGLLTSDTRKMESVIEDVLKSASVAKTEESLFDTNVSKLVNGTLEDVRSKKVCGVVSGPAGGGKTCAIQQYKEKNASALFVTATKWSSSARGICKRIFKEVETRGFDPEEENMWDFMSRKLKDSGRLIIIDNAHRLHKVAFDALFDFHDETRVGIAFIGNSQVLNTIARNDQHFSRCAIKVHVRLDPKKVRSYAEEMAHRVFNSRTTDGLIDLAEQVINNHGQARALKHQLNLAADICSASKISPEEAFQAAHKQLFREYQLES